MTGSRNYAVDAAFKGLVFHMLSFDILVHWSGVRSQFGWEQIWWNASICLCV